MTAAMTPVTSDRTLLHRLRDGDPRALRDVHDRYSARVLAVARRIVVDPRAAEDVAQEVFAYLWCHIDRVDLDRGTLGAFLTVVTRQRAVDHVRSESRWRARHDRLAVRQTATGPTTEADIADDVVAADLSSRRRAELHDAVHRLPDEQRHAVVLAYFQGRTFREVAHDLGVPEGTAKSRVRLALRRLGRELAMDPAGVAAVSDVRRAS